jgi:tetratricopeptide (TPR) repeat protein
MASALTALAFWGFAPAKDTLLKAQNAARRALELDDRSAEASVAAGMVSWFLDWNLADAERRFAQAIAFAPSDPRALEAAGVFCASMRSDFDRGVAQVERALDVDPFSVVAYSNAAWPNYWGGRYERAIAICRRALEMDPRSLMARHVLGAAILGLGHIQDAMAVFQQSYAAHGDPTSLAYLGVASARAGALDQAREIAVSLEEWPDRRAVRPSLLTWVWAASGRNKSALDWMERAIADRDVLVLWSRISRWYDPLRSEPRFQSLLNGLPLLPELHAAHR